MLNEANPFNPAYYDHPHSSSCPNMQGSATKLYLKKWHHHVFNEVGGF